MKDSNKTTKAANRAAAGSPAASPEASEDQFPFKLHRLLEDAETHGFTDSITWSKDGKSFLVLNKHRLEHEIMPRYFSSAKFKSFQRSLNLWGFSCDKRVHHGPGTRRHHPSFVRGSPHLCHGMQRTRVKQPGTRTVGSSTAKVLSSAPAKNSSSPPASSSSKLPVPSVPILPLSLTAANASLFPGYPGSSLQALISASEAAALSRGQVLAHQQQLAILQAQEIAALSALLPQQQPEEDSLLKQLVAARLRDIQEAMQTSLVQQRNMPSYR